MAREYTNPETGKVLFVLTPEEMSEKNKRLKISEGNRRKWENRFWKATAGGVIGIAILGYFAYTKGVEATRAVNREIYRGCNSIKGGEWELVKIELPQDNPINPYFLKTMVRKDVIIRKLDEGLGIYPVACDKYAIENNDFGYRLVPWSWMSEQGDYEEYLNAVEQAIEGKYCPQGASIKDFGTAIKKSTTDGLMEAELECVAGDTD